MKKFACLVFACALCSVFALTACSNSAGSSSAASSSAESAGAEATQTGIEKAIVGTWVTIDRGGKPELTNDKVVFDIISDTKARVSAQFELTPGGPLTWKDFWDADVAISGNKMTVTDHPGENATAVSEFTISDIDSDEFTADHEVVLTVNGSEAGRMEDTARYVKVDADYAESILGTWEGRLATEGDKEFRSEYKADGTYVYYLKDGDNWVASGDSLNEYFVAGNLLCQRWVENGQENRRHWEISIDDDTMRWNALRQGDDGKTFVENCVLKKVA